jgi:cell shape-determining protein MreC
MQFINNRGRRVKTEKRQKQPQIPFGFARMTSFFCGVEKKKKQKQKQEQEQEQEQKQKQEQKQEQEQTQILRLTTPKLKSACGSVRSG